MKHFTISLPNSKVDSKGEYKNFLLKRLLQSYPELVIDGIDTEESPYSYQYVGPSERILFGPCPYSIADVCRYRNKFQYLPIIEEDNIEDYNIATNFERAMRKLDKYYKEKYGYKKLYDFKLADGTPVKEYQNFIQVGYNLIPKNNMYNYLNNLSEENKITIINFIVTINNTTEYNF